MACHGHCTGSLIAWAYFLVTVSVSGHALATDWYVNGSAGSGGSGTQSAPFKTIQQGLNAAQPGDVVHVHGGTYAEGLTTTTHGTAAHPITVQSMPGESVIITGTSGERLQLAGNYWIFDGLTIDQNGILEDAVEIKAHDIILRHLEIRNGRREGISIEQAYAITVEDSYIHDFMWIDGATRRDAHCIMLDTDVGPNIHDIHIYRNTIERCSGDGLQIFGVTGQSNSTFAKNIEIIDNIFRDGTTDSQMGLTENALDFKAGDTVLVKGNTMTGYKNDKTIVVQKACRNITIEDNVLLNGDRGLEMRQEGGIDFIQENQKVLRNIVMNMQGYGLKFDGVKNLTVLHNTLIDIQGNAIFMESSLGSSVPSVDGGTIQNNLMSSTGSGRIKDPASNLLIGFNGWFQSSAGDLTSSSDTTGAIAGLVNPGGGDFSLLATSPAIDAGAVVGLPYQGSAPDLGAKEFFAEPDTTPPDPPVGLRITETR